MAQWLALLAETKTDIIFPGLGITLRHVGRFFQVFGYRIAYYGLVIGIGMVLGYLVADRVAKKTGQNPDPYLDFTLIAIIISVICARIYYVVFNWKLFADDPWEVFNIRGGGLAIYGGVIGGILTAVIFTKIRKLPRRLFLDTAVCGLITGQIIGRWGNFFNREAFGTYTNGKFAMLVDATAVNNYCNPNTPSSIVENAYAGKEKAMAAIMEIRNNPVVRNGVTYISVHPTFLYESLWNLILLILMLLRTKHKKFDGEIFLLYLFGYGLGRFWIEGLRTDQLFLFNTPIAVSQLLSALLMVGAGAAYIWMRRNAAKKRSEAK